MNIIDFFDHGAALFPQRCCLADDTQSLTYKETQILTHRIALALQAQGVGEGSKVALLSPNTTHIVLAKLGLYRSGASCVPLNARNKPEENIGYAAKVGADWLFYHSPFEGQARAMRDAIPGMRGAVCIDKALEGAPFLLDWFAEYHGNAAPLAENPDRIAMLGSTGGTTGTPKAVCATDRVFETMVACFLHAMPCDEPPVHLLVAPVTHAAGVFSYPLFATGATHVTMSNVDPEKIMQMIEQHRVTHLFLPPTIIYMMLAHPKVRDYDYSSLKYFLYAAAPMSSDKLRGAMDVFGPVMVQCFGQAEAPMMITFMTAQDHVEALTKGNEQRLRSCGRPTPFARVAIMDEDGTLLGNHERGEIVVRSGLVMSGYYNDEEATAAVSTHGWHHTGDIGYADDDGFIYIVDRKRDMIISGGFNVFPSEVEQVIWAHEAVQDCAVIGVPDEKWGEAVKAVIELKPGKMVTESEIIGLCKEKLGGVKAPKSVEVWERLPRSAVGKVLKKEIRRAYWEGQDRAI